MIMIMVLVMMNVMDRGVYMMITDRDGPGHDAGRDARHSSWCSS